ncbi:MAG: ABC transporter permease [Microbacteriaceae bacterium]
MTNKQPINEHTESIDISQLETAGLSQGQIVYKRFTQHKLAVASVFMLIAIVVIAFTSVGFSAFGFTFPGWWQWPWATLPPNPVMVNGGEPTFTLWPFAIGDHPFGQDSIRRDMFALIMRGLQQSIIVMFLTGFLATLIGIVIGAVSGYFRGWTDTLLMRFTEVIIIIPILIIGAVLGQMVGGGGAVAIGTMIGLFSWPAMARLVRAEFLGLREREFVDAARVAGAGNGRIIFRHILPNTVGTIIVNTTLLMSAAVLLETSLSFLGFGILSPDVSLGSLISTYQGAFQTRPWLFWIPGVLIVLLTLCINFIGDGLRDAFDPRQRRMPDDNGPWKQLWRFITRQQVQSKYVRGGQ